MNIDHCYYKLIFLLVILYSCHNEQTEGESKFSLLDSEKSGVTFSNNLHFEREFNIYTYRNFYNGGGVGIGDINNDGYVDIYFTGNMVPNKLYLNNGDLSFTDISEKAGVEGKGGWSTGVSMADINGDGYLDIYVCNSGDVKGDNKQNELFINQGDGTFKEEAERYGLADRGFSTHAAFFDYDRDGDLDVYLLNNSFQAIGSFNLKKNQRPIRNPEGGDKLFRNDNGYFTDVSEEAGIYGSIIGFGLGVTVGDINQDGWQDIYVSNDFFERDYIYMNNHDGTFTENLESQMKSISGASMGADMADINNDGYPDIFVTEMLPEPNGRLKTKTTFENWDRYQYNVSNGYYHQFTRNMLQLNNGNNTFSEIGRMLGVEATDWSWGALITDFDNDGFKDLFIANGIQKDLTDQDYINYVSSEEVTRALITKEGVDYKRLIEIIPSNKISNYMYQNKGNLKFENVTDTWGLAAPSHSNGSAYADLDNDGDLDIVINNSNAIANIYLNHTQEQAHAPHYLKIIFKGEDKNSYAVGAIIEVVAGDDKFYYQQMPVKGFQSSVDPRPNIGLGQHGIIDSLKIIWPDGRTSLSTKVKANQTVTLDVNTAEMIASVSLKSPGAQVFQQSELPIDFKHVENEFVDFDRDRLIYHMLSSEGPAFCMADFNSDGLSDFYIGGAKDQSGTLYLQNVNGTYSQKSSSIFENDANAEDVACSCFDADGDGDIDMYVASGGSEFSSNSSALIDRLYFNDGRGNMTKSNQILPSFQFQNSSCVEAADVDADGDMDLFVGVRARPNLIGVPADGYLLLNDGAGKFTDVTASKAPEFKDLGMITAAKWADIDGDGDLDLTIVGEWMRISVFNNEGGRLTDISTAIGLDSTNGWWNAIASADLDNDGDIDFVVGNHGYNSRFTASRDKPTEIFVNDFDNNGTAEAIITTYFKDHSYPLVLKHDLVAQLPSLKKKYVDYETYEDEDVHNIFTIEQLERAKKSAAYEFASAILINNGENGFKLTPLPIAAQLAPVFAIAIDDFDQDGINDILLGGNFYRAKPEVGRYDASYGCFLKGLGDNKFNYVENKSSGFFVDGEVRAFGITKSDNEKAVMVARNNDTMLKFTYK